jgi:signal peptidase I
MAATAKKDGVWETVKTVIYALLIAGIFRTLFFQPFWIPTGSMKDTLLIGDFLFVNKMAYGYSKYSCPFSMCPIPGRIFGVRAPERGDIIVFKPPGHQRADFIKRLIGLPGDTVQVRDGILYINGDRAAATAAGVFEEVFERQGSFGTTFPNAPTARSARAAICEKDRAPRRCRAA